MPAALFRLLLLLPAGGSFREVIGLRPGADVHQLTRTGFCAPLSHKGPVPTVKVKIGTPAQEFSLVADTGSSALVVESCVCEEQGNCQKDNKCFKGGKGISTTFEIPDNLMGVQVTYGSGPMQAVMAHDKVNVGGLETRTPLLLMVDKQMNGIEFQGILGLGLPHKELEKNKATAAAAAKAAGQPHATPQALAAAGGGQPLTAASMGFLDMAKASRFSMCFSKEGETGVLRMGEQVNMAKPLGNIGQMHWGLAFHGITLGEATGKTHGKTGNAGFCHSEVHGQETPCCAVIDSGTELIMAPKEQLASLLGSLCETWTACKPQEPSLVEMHGASEEAKHALALEAKVHGFLEAAKSCPRELESLPSLTFHLKGRGGEREKLVLSPSEYMLETPVEKMQEKWLTSLMQNHKVPTVEGETQCIPAFRTMEYPTKKNGPAWILGAPFFYKYSVAYDRKKLAIAFDSSAGCPACTAGGGAQLLQRGGHEAAGTAPGSLVARRAQRSMLRFLDAEPYDPFFNTSLPF